jgi:hypothetical protein
MELRRDPDGQSAVYIAEANIVTEMVVECEQTAK